MTAESMQEPVVPVGDPFGNVIDPGTVEAWLGNTLRAWIDSHLAHQERRWELQPGTIERPASWPNLSTYRLDLEDQLPAIVVVFNGEVAAARQRLTGGGVRKAYAFDVTAAVAGIDEADARASASRYIAAIESIVEQRFTLDDQVEKAVAVGPIAPAAGQALDAAGNTVGERAVYRTTVHVYVRNTVNPRLGTDQPPDDPYNPGDLPPTPEEVEVIEVDSEESQ